MENLITINNQDVLVKQCKGHMVLTFKDIDNVHGRPNGTARKRFYDNKKRFIEGEDYFNIQTSEKRTLGFEVPNRGMVVLTESGYLMLAKSFTDDLAWEVQRQLVNGYFNYKETKAKNKQLEFYDYFDKTYNGEPVLSSMDVSYFTSINCGVIRWFARKHLVKGIDYYCLVDDELRKYKNENVQISRFVSSVVIFTQNGFDKICKAYGIEVEMPKLFIEDKKVLPVKKNSGYEQVDVDDYITTLRVLRAVRKNSLNILEKDRIDAFDRCIHYVCMNATASTIK